MKDALNEERLRERYQTAVRLIKMEFLPLDKIAEGTNLPIETVKELAEKTRGSRRKLKYVTHRE